MAKCPCCGGDHDYPQVDCDGTPIDWAARKQRARDYLKWRKVEQRMMTDIYGKTMMRWWEVTVYPYQDEVTQE